jgi:hypothetical protein
MPVLDLQAYIISRSGLVMVMVEPQELPERQQFMLTQDGVVLMILFFKIIGRL